MLPLREIARRAKLRPSTCRRFILREGISYEYRRAPDARGHVQRQMFALWNEFREARHKRPIDENMLPLREIAKRVKRHPVGCRTFVLRHGIKHEYRIAPDISGKMRRQMFVSWPEFQQARQELQKTPCFDGDMLPLYEIVRRVKRHRKTCRVFVLRHRIKYEYRIAPDISGKMQRQMFVSWPEFQQARQELQKTPCFDGNMLPLNEIARRIKRHCNTCRVFVLRHGIKHEYRIASNGSGKTRRQMFASWPEFQQARQELQKTPCFDGDMLPLREIAERAKLHRMTCQRFILRRGLKYEYRRAPDARGHMQHQMFASLSQFQQARQQAKYPMSDKQTAPPPDSGQTNAQAPAVTDQDGATAGNVADAGQPEQQPKGRKKGGRPVSDQASPRIDGGSGEPNGESVLLLDERSRCILQALVLLEALDADHKVTLSDMAEKAFGKGTDPHNLRRPLRKLRKWGMIESRIGRDGGIWLTAAGLPRAQSLFGQRDK